MNKGRQALSGLFISIQLLIVGAVIALASGVSSVGATGALTITGTVTSATGSAVAGVSVTVTEPGSSAVVYGPSTTNSAGSYVIGVDAGTYDFHFDAPSGGPFNSIVKSNVAIVGNQTVNVQLTSASRTFSGTITDANGNPVPRITVGLGGNYSARTNSAGFYTMTLPAGSYHLSGSGGNQGTGPLGIAGLPSFFTFGNATTGPLVDLTSSDVTQNIQLPTTATLTVTLKDSNGNPASGSISGSGSGTAAVLNGRSDGVTVAVQPEGSVNASGTFTDTVFRNLTFAAGAVCSNGTCNGTATNTNNGDTTINLVKIVTHTVSGTITDANGNPVSGIILNLNGVNGVRTNAAGQYTITVNAGVYHLSGDAGGANGPLGNSNLPDFFSFGNSLTGPLIDLTNGNVTQNIQLPSTKTLSVTVKDLLGSPIATGVSANGSGNIAILAGRTETVVVNVNPQYVSTNASGLYTGKVFTNLTYPVGSICAAGSCSTETYSTATGDVNVTLTKIVTHTVTGTVRDANNNPVPGIAIAVGPQGTITDSNGFYSLTLDQGTYRISGQGGNANGPLQVDGLPGNFTFGGLNSYVDLTTSNVVQDIKLPMTTILEVTLKDENGMPKTGQITAQGSGVSTTLLTGQNIETPYAMGLSAATGTNGVMTAVVFRGLTFSAGAICGNGCTASELTTNTGPLSILLQTTPPQPTKPTALSAVSPAKVPHLTWTAASGASSYNIYRGGTKVGTSTMPSYDDTSVPEGTVEYYVTAVNSGGESGTSNTISVVVDATGPVLTYTVNPTANSKGWNTSDVTVTFACSDPAVVATCPEPVTLSTDSATQTVTATAIDTIGNATTITTTPIKIDKTLPVISYTVSPVANSAGWNNTNVTVTFACNDALSGVQDCSSPVTLSTEGASRSVVGTVTDKAGNAATVSATIKLDKTAPTVSSPTMANTLFLLGGSTAVSANATDALSGVVAGEYYIDTDPGQGSAGAMSYGNGKITGTAVVPNNLSVGFHKLYMRTKDAAGNWSSTTSINFFFL